MQNKKNINFSIKLSVSAISRYKLKTTLIITILVIMATLLVSCDGYLDAVGNLAESPTLPQKSLPPATEQPSEKPTPTPQRSEQPEEPEDLEEYDPSKDPEMILELNPLTGRAEWMNKFAVDSRPVAIIIENQKVSLPQLGLAEADIIIEMPVESEINRFAAIFKDPYAIEKIGAVRSLRSYFTKMILAFDCYLYHYGFSDSTVESARRDLLNRGMTTVNGLYGEDDGRPYWRDWDRINQGMDSVHAVVTAGPNLLESMQGLPRARTLLEKQSKVFKFNVVSSTQDGSDGQRVYLKDMYLSNPYFIYDEERNAYGRYQFADMHIDGNTGEQLFFDNVFILRMPVQPINNSLRHVSVTTHGSGTGYYFNEGKYVEISWYRETDSSAFVFKYNNQTLDVKEGKSWISCVPLYGNVVIQ